METAETDIVWLDDDDVDTPIPKVSLRTEILVSSTARAFDPSCGLVLDESLIFSEPSEPLPKSMTHLLDSEWDWKALRDYVVSSSTDLHGPFPRDPAKEATIFRSFIQRWGADKAQAIARVAFEVHGGMWRGAPVRVERFCKASDNYFAAVLVAN